MIPLTADFLVLLISLMSLTSDQRSGLDLCPTFSIYSYFNPSLHSGLLQISFRKLPLTYTQGVLQYPSLSFISFSNVDFFLVTVSQALFNIPMHTVCSFHEKSYTGLHYISSSIAADHTALEEHEKPSCTRRMWKAKLHLSHSLITGCPLVSEWREVNCLNL